MSAWRSLLVFAVVMALCTVGWLWTLRTMWLWLCISFVLIVLEGLRRYWATGASSKTDKFIR